MGTTEMLIAAIVALGSAVAALFVLVRKHALNCESQREQLQKDLIVAHKDAKELATGALTDVAKSSQKMSRTLRKVNASQERMTRLLDSHISGTRGAVQE